MLFATTPTNPINGRELLANEQGRLRLGLDNHPLGPPADPGLVQAAEVYDAILTGKPYPVKAAVLFGTDPLLRPRRPAARQSRPRSARLLRSRRHDAQSQRTLRRLDTAGNHLLGARSVAALLRDRRGYDELGTAAPGSRQTVGESRSEAEIIFDLAKRLDLTEHFFDGNIEAALAYQLAPSGLTTEQLRANPVGMRASVTTRHRKYAEIDTVTGQAKGFQHTDRQDRNLLDSFRQSRLCAHPAFETSESRTTATIHSR